MKVIVDKLKYLNYHPLKVYFLLSSKDFEEYGQMLEKLSNYKGYSRGIFKFHTVQRGRFNNVLAEDFCSTIKRYNVIVRLVDDIDGIFNYALAKIPISQDPDLFEYKLQSFIKDVCKRNISHLQSQLQLVTEGRQASIIRSMISGFESAIHIQGYKRGVWRKLLYPALTCRFICHKNIPDSIKVIRKSVYDNLTDQKIKEDFKKMMSFFEEHMDIPSLKESDAYAWGTINQNYSQALNNDYNSRVKGYDRPNITIAIKKVKSAVLKTKIKQSWGIEFNIDGTVVPVYIGSTAAAMVYICTLLKHSMGTFLYRDIFKRSISSKSRHEDIIWLEEVYNVLYPGAPTDFKLWYEKMRNDSCRFISQGKSESIRVINDKLKDHPNAIYYCSIQVGTFSQKQSYYYFDLPKDCIRVPKEFETLVY